MPKAENRPVIPATAVFARETKLPTTDRTIKAENRPVAIPATAVVFAHNTTKLTTPDRTVPETCEVPGFNQKGHPRNKHWRSCVNYDAPLEKQIRPDTRHYWVQCLPCIRAYNAGYLPHPPPYVVSQNKTLDRHHQDARKCPFFKFEDFTWMSSAPLKRKLRHVKSSSEGGQQGASDGDDCSKFNVKGDDDDGNCSIALDCSINGENGGGSGTVDGNSSEAEGDRLSFLIPRIREELRRDEPPPRRDELRRDEPPPPRREELCNNNNNERRREEQQPPPPPSRMETPQRVEEPPSRVDETGDARAASTTDSRGGTKRSLAVVTTTRDDVVAPPIMNDSLSFTTTDGVSRSAKRLAAMTTTTTPATATTREEVPPMDELISNDVSPAENQINFTTGTPKEFVQRHCILALRRLSRQGAISHEQKRCLITDIITCATRGVLSRVEVAYNILLYSNDGDAENDVTEEEFVEQCHIFATSVPR